MLKPTEESGKKEDGVSFSGMIGGGGAARWTCGKSVQFRASIACTGIYVGASRWAACSSVGSESSRAGVTVVEKIACGVHDGMPSRHSG
jgi:hypothetical protein